MVKHLALLSLLATPLALAAQGLMSVQDDFTVVAAPDTPRVTYDIVGTFPANVPVTRMTAPNASFLLEISFDQTVPADTYLTFYLDAYQVSGTYSYEGRTYRVTSGDLGIHNHANNQRSLSFTTCAGTLEFRSGGFDSPPVPDFPLVGVPVHANRPTPTAQNPIPAGSATFLAVDAGAQGAWHYTFTNVRGQSITGYYANVLDVVGRLVMPKPAGLAERQGTGPLDEP